MNTLRRKAHLAVLRLLGRERETYAPHGIHVSVPRDADVKLRYDLARGRPYEEAEASMIRAYLKPGTAVIELGGCLGIISALIRSRIGPTASHIVVEANPILAELCALNARIGAGVDATRIVVAAVDYSGEATVSFNTGRTAHGGHVMAGGGLSVQAITLESLAKWLPDGQFALICDIEGAEVALIEAEAALLQRVSLLILETHPKVYAHGMADTVRIVSLIEATGLKCTSQVKNVYAFVR